MRELTLPADIKMYKNDIIYMEYNIKYMGYNGYTIKYIKYIGFGTHPNQFKHIFMDFGHFWRFGAYIFPKTNPSTPPKSPATILAIYSETKPRDHSHENRLEKLV